MAGGEKPPRGRKWVMLAETVGVVKATVTVFQDRRGVQGHSAQLVSLRGLGGVLKQSGC